MSRLTSNLRKLDSVGLKDAVIKSRFRWYEAKKATEKLSSEGISRHIDDYIKSHGIIRMTTTNPTRNRIVQKFIILMESYD